MFNFPYTAVQLTEQINRYPNVYGLMNALGIFPSIGVPTRVVEIRFEDGKLVVLASDEVGAPGQVTERETGGEVYIGIPHFPHLENILARDLQDFLDVVAGQKVPKTFVAEVAKRLRFIRNNHAITREYARMGALRGLVKDGRGRTVIDLFKAFKVQRKVIDFALGSADTDVIGNFAALIDYMGEAMLGETMSRVEIICGRDWFSKLIQHRKVEKYWLNTMNAGHLAEGERSRLGGQWGRVFEFQTVMVREYTGSFPVRNPNTGALISEKIMGPNEARAYPVGTLNSFATYDGPINALSKINRPGEEIYISPRLLDHEEGVEFKSQSNCLPICKRPEFLVDCSTSN